MRTSEFTDIEAALARLMPPPLSQGGQQELEAMIDELAGSGEATVFPWKSISAIAAGIFAAVGGFALKDSPAILASAMTAPPPQMVLISESDQVQSIHDEGWSEQRDGSAMHSIRLRMIEKNRLMDEETGIVMQISEPREEIFLTPICAF